MSKNASDDAALTSNVLHLIARQAVEQELPTAEYQAAVIKELAAVVRKSPTTSAEAVATMIFNAGYRKVADAR